MPRNCTICNHPQLKEITHALIARRPYRSIQARYGVNKSAIVRHLKRQVTKALRKLTRLRYRWRWRKRSPSRFWGDAEAQHALSKDPEGGGRGERPHGGAARGEGMPAESGVDCEADGRA